VLRASPSPYRRTLIDTVTDAKRIDEINNFAIALSEMNEEEVMQYKTVIEATECKALPDAEELWRHLGEYTITTNISSPIEMAHAELDFMMGEDEAKRLKPFVDLYGYGKAVIERYGGKLTTYGFIERKDLQPMPSVIPQMSTAPKRSCS